MSPELAPGAIEPDGGLNCAPDGELEPVQLKFPVELELLLSVTVQVVSCPVAAWQLPEYCTWSEWTPPPKPHAHSRLKRAMRVSAVQSLRNISSFSSGLNS
jgi:hypothetical protein